MFSWVGGLKSGTGTGDNAQHDSTFVDAPETPAPVFALRAFKHAIYGTPQQQNTSTAILRKKSSDSIIRPSQEQPRWLPSTSDQRSISPSKPNGILMTPGTINGRRKQVTFGSQVKDEQENLPVASSSRTALPVPPPVKLPLLPIVKSKEDEKLEKLRKKTKSAKSEKRLDKTDKKGYEVPLQALELLGAAPYQQTHSRKPSNASQNDSAHTTDLDEPHSESGRYWKEAFESYSDRSEAETKVLIAKARLAKDFARKKDDEVMELRMALENERRRNGGDKQKKHRREESLEAEVKELREKLRLQAAENSRTTAELATLRRQLTGNATMPVPQVISHKHQASRTDSVQSDAFNDLIIPEEPTPEGEIHSSSNISMWAAAGATSDFRRSVETIKSATSNHIIDQMSGALGASRTKKRTDKLRRTTSKREIADGKAHSTTSTASTSSGSNSRSDAASLQIPAYSAFATTPLSPIDDILEPSGIADDRDSRPHTADTERPSSRSLPTSSSPTLPLKLVSPELAIPRTLTSASAGSSVKSDVHRVDSKRMSSPPRIGDIESENSEDDLPPTPPPKTASQSTTSLAQLERQRQNALNQLAKPSEATTGNSTRSGSPVPSLTKSRHAPSSSSSGVLPQFEKENLNRPQAGSRKKTSGAIIDADRLAAARARIAARKAMGPKT